jgi:type II restriction enzyme
MNISLISYYEKYNRIYHSNSQLARVISENWCIDSLYCPLCISESILPYENNKKVADFYCKNCGEEYQLKSKKEPVSYKIIDGEYNTMLKAINSNTLPNFFIMSYSNDWTSVDNFILIPKTFILPENIIKRKPLSQTARRAGWTGCIINLQEIFDEAKIPIISGGNITGISDVRRKAARISSMNTDNLEARTWVNDVMLILDKINKPIFTLSDVYNYSHELKTRHPHNNNVEAKIRQQLQIIRDKGFLEFLERGVYKKI